MTVAASTGRSLQVSCGAEDRQGTGTLKRDKRTTHEAVHYLRYLHTTVGRSVRHKPVQLPGYPPAAKQARVEGACHSLPELQRDAAVLCIGLTVHRKTEDGASSRRQGPISISLTGTNKM